MNPESRQPLRRTALHSLHLALGARMGPFAGFDMPVSFAGPVEEHRYTRLACSLFDVSHMLVCDVIAPEAAHCLEALTPTRLTDLACHRSRYLVFTNERGGVIDDAIATGREDGVRFVLNAARAETDLAHLRAHLGEAVQPRRDLGLLALQGPLAAEVLERAGIETGDIRFMQSKCARLVDVDIELSRSGYTGEDGFELTAPVERLPDVAVALLDEAAVAPAGLAARDSLRLEAGLCLYGNDLDEDTTPVEAGLVWTIPKDRRALGGFLGAERVAAQLRGGGPRRLVGIRPAGRRPVRAGNVLRTVDGTEAGSVTSGGWAATVGGPVAMGYVTSGLREPGTYLVADVRGVDVACEVVRLPFVPHRYVR